MALPLAEAFVRIRPRTNTFKAEAEKDLNRDSEKMGSTAGASFWRMFAARIRGQKLPIDTSAFRTQAQEAAKSFADGFTRDAAGRLRNARGHFAAEGAAAGAGFGDAFVRDATGRLRDARGRFVSEGRSGGGALGDGFSIGAFGGVRGIQALIAAGIALGPAIIPVAAAAAAALAAIGPAALVGVAAIGVTALGFSGIADAVKAMSAAQKDAAKSSATLSASQAAVASASDGVRSAQRSLIDAERELTLAQRDARDVVRELDEARQQATRRLADLNSSVKENALSQRQANLDVAEAKRELDRILADPKATAEQREQARVSYERQVLQQEDLKRRGRELAEDQTKANRAGVEGSREVVAARDRIAAANERVRRAERGVVEAQQSVIAAQRALQQASVRAGVASTSAMDKLRESLAALSPAGRTFAAFLFGLKDEFKSLRDAAQAGLLPGVQKAIETLLPYLPQIRSGIGAVAKLVGDLALMAARAFTSPFWRDFFSDVGKTGIATLKQFFQAGLNVAKAFAGIVRAFMPLSGDVGQGLVDLTQKFADWAASLGESKGFQQFLAYVRENGPRVLKFFRDLFVIGGKLLVGLAPLGEMLLKGLGFLAGVLAKLDPGVLLLIAAAIGAVVAVAGAPIYGVVIAITALAGAVYYAWTRFETFREVVLTVVRAVAAAGLWLWRNAIKPAFDGISTAAQWAYEHVLKPVFEGIRWYATQVVGPWMLWLYDHVIKPVWERIKIAFSVGAAAAKVAFGLFQIAIKIAGAAFGFWYTNWIKPIWDKVRPILAAVGSFIADKVVPAFKAGLSALGKAWDGLMDISKKPVKFVIETVLNKGILAGYNKIAKLFGVKPDDVQIPLPKGFARGGILPGYTPGRDPHVFRSATGGTLALSGGEAIIRPEGTRALGKDWIDGINRAARTGGTSGAARFLGGFADGGIFGGAKDLFNRAKNKATDVIKGAVDFARDPAGFLRGLAKKLIDLVPGKDTSFGRIATGLPSKAVGFLADKVGSFFGGNDGGPGNGRSPFGGSAGMMAALRAVFPGLPLTSGFRPGSRTLSGNVSYHASDRAVDVPPTRAVAEFIFRSYRALTRELITPWRELDLRNGRPHRYDNQVHNQHNFPGGNAHVHWAARLGGILPRIPIFDAGGTLAPGLNVVDNRTGGYEHLVPTGQRTHRAVHIHFHNSVIASKQQAEDLVVDAYNSAKQHRRID